MIVMKDACANIDDVMLDLQTLYPLQEVTNMNFNFIDFKMS